MTTETQTPGTAAAGNAPAATPPAAAAPAAAPAATAAQPDGTGTLPTGAPAADQKPDASAAPAAGDKPADGKPADTVADYADFKAPEGATLNPEVVTELKAFAKEKGLTQEEAQKLVDLGVKNAQANHAALVDQIAKTQAQWLEASRTDQEIGGDKLAENMAVAKKARDAFGTPELNTLLDQSGLGNHPEVIRAFYRIGQAISEDRFIPANGAAAGGDRLSRMYPTMKS